LQCRLALLSEHADLQDFQRLRDKVDAALEEPDDIETRRRYKHKSVYERRAWERLLPLLDDWGDSDLDLVRNHHLGLVRERVAAREPEVKELATKLAAAAEKGMRDLGPDDWLEEARRELAEKDERYKQDRMVRQGWMEPRQITESKASKHFGRKYRVRSSSFCSTDHYAFNPRLLQRDLAEYIEAKDQDTPVSRLSLEAEKELALLNSAEGLSRSPVFGYDVDYSQFKPRGHYTESAHLRHYFRAMMWYGRLVFLVNGGESKHGCLVSEETARRQTMAACAIAELLPKVRVADGRTAHDVWQRIYGVTGFFVGTADDLTPGEYRRYMRQADAASWNDLAENARAVAVKELINRRSLPGIHSGIGAMWLPPARVATNADLAAALRKTIGMRFMGQRYIPDSEIMGLLVYPCTGEWTGGKPAFTTVSTKYGTARGMPRGLDVMAVMGSTRARALLKESRDDQYENFDAMFAGLRDAFVAIPDAEVLLMENHDEE